MKTCDENLSQLNMLAEHEIEPGSAQLLNEHLRSCPKCSAEFKELQQAKGLIEESLAARVGVPDVHEAVLQRISGPAKPVRHRHRFLRWAGLSLAAAAAIVVLAAAAFLYHLGFIGPKPVAARFAYVSTSGGEWERAKGKIRGMTVVSSKAGKRVALRLENGVQIILNENTTVNVQSVNQLNLLKGNIYINTAGQKGVLLRIKTRQASTLVTGTKLGVSADPEETSVVVEEGKVSVEGNWGEQVVTHGNIFRIIQSMKPEPPEPVNLEEVFFWVKERAHLEGMIIDLYEPESEEVTSITNEKELLQKILYGLEQSRDAIRTGDIVFDTASFKYGYDLTDEEKKEYLEQMVQGHIAQLNLKQPPSEQQFNEIVQNVVNSVVQQSRTRTSDSASHWMFELPDKVRQEIFDDESKQFVPAMLINGHTRYWPLRGSAEFTQDDFPVKGRPAYFGRSETPVSELSNPRLIRTEEVNGVMTYLLEADLLGYETVSAQPVRYTVQLWVDPDRNYLVLKTRKYMASYDQPKMQTCLETIADSFEEVSPGVFYPRTFTETQYTGEMISGELVLRKTDETVYTLREGQFNTPLATQLFDITIPPDVPVEEFRAEWVKKAISPLVSNISGPTNASTPEGFLREVYAELEQIKMYDDPSAPGSHKLILRLNGKKLEDTLRNRGGVIVTSAIYRGEVVGVRVNSVDPAIAAEVPFMNGDVIFTLNDEPWKIRGPLDWVSGLESCIPIVNSGRPITAGIQRHGNFYYVILWFD